MMPRALRNLDPLLTILILGLTLLGVTMVYSSAGVHAADSFGNEFAYLSKQVQFAALGVVAMFTVASVPYQIWKRLTYPFLIIVILLLIAVLIPGVGVTMGGATRWLDFGVAYLQPSEIAKFSVLIYLAYSLESGSKIPPKFTSTLTRLSSPIPRSTPFARPQP